MHLIDELLTSGTPFIEPDSAHTVTAVPESVVALCPIRSFIIDKEHVLLFTRDIGNHAVTECFLLHMPDYPAISFGTCEIGSGHGPELGKVEFVVLSLVMEG